MSVSDDARARVTTDHIDDVRRWREILAQIRAGRLPTLDEIYQGSGLTGHDWTFDCRLWCTDLLLRDDLEEVRDRIEHLRDTCSVPALFNAWTAAEHEHGSICDRLDVYLTIHKNPEAHGRLVVDMLQSGYGSQSYRRSVFAIEVARNSKALIAGNGGHGRGYEALIKSTAAAIEMAAEAEKLLDAGVKVQTPEDYLHGALEAMALLQEDRSEIDPSIPVPKGLIVLPAAEALAATKGHRKDVVAPYIGIIGATLPFAYAPDPVDAAEQFGTRLPHALSAFVRILGHHQKGDPLNLGQWLLVGPPGTGKTTFIRILAEVLGMPVEIHGLGGAADSSIMGTSSQWSTARAHPILQFINEKKISNPLIGWDEIEKVGTARHNGNALDALLPILERHTAAKHRDLALECEINLSMVSHIATANSLEGLSQPVRDRFRIIQMPSPEWQHIGVLSRSILDKLAEERGLDPRWFPDLAGDEIEGLKTVWSGGSIRRLEQALKILVEGRDQLLGKA